MYPPMLALHPTLARSLLQYRFDRIPGARIKAHSYTPPFDGTMFPWESARTVRIIPFQMESIIFAQANNQRMLA
jgi:trehalose/maltose hydrolase-like predicted phosphorylase